VTKALSSPDNKRCKRTDRHSRENEEDGQYWMTVFFVNRKIGEHVNLLFQIITECGSYLCST